MKTWGGVVAGLVNFALAVVLVGFGVWAVKEIGALKISVAEIRAWQGNHVAAIEVEKKTLKLEIESSMEKTMRGLIERAEAKQDRLVSDMRDTDKVVRETAAQISVLRDTVSQLSLTVSQLKANITQALVNADFERNQPKP